MTKSLQIAIADDETDIRLFFERIVVRMGHEVLVSVGNGRELVERCRLQPPDLIITDVLMPEMDGIEAACEISKDHTIPVIVISSYDISELKDSDCPCIVAFLRKPIKMEQLQSAVSQVVASHSVKA